MDFPEAMATVINENTFSGLLEMGWGFCCGRPHVSCPEITRFPLSWLTGPSLKFRVLKGGNPSHFDSSPSSRPHLLLSLLTHRFALSRTHPPLSSPRWHLTFCETSYQGERRWNGPDRCWRFWGPSPSSNGVSFSLGKHVTLDDVTLMESHLCLISWLAWTCDAIDFFSVSLTVTNLQTQFNKSTHSVVSIPHHNTPHLIPPSQFHLLTDDIHHSHLALPARWCRKLSLISIPLHAPPPHLRVHRSSSVSSPIDSVASGPWSVISSSSPSSPSAQVLSRPSRNSSPSEASSASAWAVSGV